MRSIAEPLRLPPCCKRKPVNFLSSLHARTHTGSKILRTPSFSNVSCTMTSYPGRLLGKPTATGPGQCGAYYVRVCDEQMKNTRTLCPVNFGVIREPLLVDIFFGRREESEEEPE